MTKQSVTPVAELGQDNLGTPVLKLSNLLPRQLRVIYEAMIVNGDTPIHDARSNALAHLGRFDPFIGVATIAVHGDDTRHNRRFTSLLAGQLGMSIPSIIAGEEEREAA